VLRLPCDHERPAVKTYTGGVVSRVIDTELLNDIRLLCDEQGSTLFMGLLAAINALLYHYSGQEDIVIGIPWVSREHADLDAQIGYYVNMLALRTKFSGNESSKELLYKVTQSAVGAYNHQEYPFWELLKALDIDHDKGLNKLFRVSAVLQNAGEDMVSSDWPEQLSISRYQLNNRNTGKFDLFFNFTDCILVSSTAMMSITGTR
jgi:non-ribosomal peptide synthetase component F